MTNGQEYSELSMGLIGSGLWHPKRIIKHLGRRLSNTSIAKNALLYRLMLIMQGAAWRPDRPRTESKSCNGALQTTDQYEQAIEELDSVGLHRHPFDSKNWDALLALKTILATTNRDGTVLDAGGDLTSPLVEWLYLYNYERLVVCNIDFEEGFNRGPVEYFREDFTDTDFPSGSFDAISCLSVIEHGVDVRAALEEFYRLLSSGGRLILSTDYWSTPISTSSKFTEYGGGVQAWKIYDESEIRSFIKEAEDVGFRTPKDVNYDTNERIVFWKGEEYTFLYIELGK